MSGNNAKFRTVTYTCIHEQNIEDGEVLFHSLLLRSVDTHKKVEDSKEKLLSWQILHDSLENL
jgi:hypothetical protein